MAVNICRRDQTEIFIYIKGNCCEEVYINYLISQNLIILKIINSSIKESSIFKHCCCYCCSNIASVVAGGLATGIYTTNSQDSVR